MLTMCKKKTCSKNSDHKGQDYLKLKIHYCKNNTWNDFEFYVYNYESYRKMLTAVVFNQ